MTDARRETREYISEQAGEGPTGLVVTPSHCRVDSPRGQVLIERIRGELVALERAGERSATRATNSRYLVIVQPAASRLEKGRYERVTDTPASAG